MSGGRGYSNINRNNQRGYYNSNGYNKNGGRGRGFRQNRYNNNNQSNNKNKNNKNNLPKEALPPMTYEAKPDKQNRIKIIQTHGRAATATTESEKIAVYDDTAKEDYLRTLAEYREILLDYPHLQTDLEATTTCRILKRCLKGSAKNSCSRVVAGVNNGVIDTNEVLKLVIEETTSAILGLNAHDNQIEYLRTAKKPRKLSVEQWMRRIQNINLHLVNMEKGAKLLTDRELIKEVIIPNLPVHVKYQLKMQGGSSLPWNRTQELLTNMFALMNWEQNKCNGNKHEGRGRRRHHNNGGRGRGQNYENNNNNNRNNDNRREETYQQNNRNEPRRNNSDANSYYSDDEGHEESNMMKARMRCTEATKNPQQNTKRPKSCTIVVNVKTATGRKSYLALADTGSSATLANKAVVSECMKNKTKKEVEWTIQGGVILTTHTAMIKDLKLPQFTRNKSVQHKMQICRTSGMVG